MNIQNLMADIFGTAKAVKPDDSTNQQQQQQNGNQSADTIMKNDGQQAGVLEQRPNPTATPTKDGNPPNPLDEFAKLFDNKGTSQQEEPLSFSLDPTKLSEIANSMDFSSAIPKELMEKMRTGDAGALIEGMNYASRAAYKDSLSHLSHLTDKFVAAKLQEAMKQTPNLVRRELTNAQLSQIPNANHPAVVNTIQSIAQSVQAANPDYTPAQVAETAMKYFQELAKAFTSPADKSAKGEGEDSPAQNRNWADYLTKS